MHTCDGCVYLGSDGYTCLRDEENERALERKNRPGLLKRLLGLFRKEKR